MNGKVVIGTELNTTDFDKDISKIEKRLEELDKKSKEPIEIKGIKVTGLNNLTDEETDEYNDLQQKMQELYNQKMELNKVEKAITQELNNQEAIIDKQKSSTQEQVSNNSSNKSKIFEMYGELEDMVREYNTIQKANIISSKDLSRTKEIKKDIKKTAKEIEKLGGGKISIRGITDIPKQFDGINKGLTKTLKKVAKWGIALFGIRTAYNAIRGAMSTLSQYDTQMADNIEYIRYALASSLQPVIQTILNLVVKLLQYINYIVYKWTGNNLFKTADAFKSAQKSASGVAKSAKEINKQLAGFDEMNVLSDTSSSGAGGGGADIASPNIDLTGMQGEIPSWVQWIVDNKDLIIAALFGIAGGIIAIKLGVNLLMGLGIGLIIAGIAQTIQAIINFIKDPSWENFAKILKGLTLILAGVAVAMLAVNAANPVAWIMLAIAAVVALAAVVIKNWDKIKEVLGKVGQWIYDHIIKPVGNFFGGLWDTLTNGAANAWKGIKNVFGKVAEFFGNVFGTAWRKVKDIFSTGGKIFEGIKEGIVETFKAIVNAIIGGINSIIGTPFRKINNLLNSIRDLSFLGISPFAWIPYNVLPIPQIPKLAKGGIINQPGRGVPIGYGQAIGGENRAEGVIPLTDSQQMQLLGEAIGRYVTINANITNTMNGRVISRELQKVNNTNDFAFNR